MPELVLSREQILTIAEALNADSNIKQVEVAVDNGGKVRVSAVVLQPVRTPIRLTKKPKTSVEVTA